MAKLKTDKNAKPVSDVPRLVKKNKVDVADTPAKAAPPSSMKELIASWVKTARPPLETSQASSKPLDTGLSEWRLIEVDVLPDESPIERAKRIKKLLVKGSGSDLEIEYKQWCKKQGIPCIIVRAFKNWEDLSVIFKSGSFRLSGEVRRKIYQLLNEKKLPGGEIKMEDPQWEVTRLPLEWGSVVGSQVFSMLQANKVSKRPDRAARGSKR